MTDYSILFGGALIAYLVVIFAFLLIAVAAYVITAIFLTKVFEKAGVDGKWRAWVPVYNMMVLSKLGDLSPWLVLYCFAGTVLLSSFGIGFLFSFAMLAVTGMAAYRVGMKLGKEPAMVALWLVPPVWAIVMGSSASHWNNAIPPAPWADNAFLADRSAWPGIPQQSPAQPPVQHAG